MSVLTETVSTRTNAEEARPVRRRNRYSKDFQRDAARIVIEQGKTITAVASEFRLKEQTLGNWVRRERAESTYGHRHGVAVTPVVAPVAEERDECGDLRRELAARNEELEAMRRAVVLLARETV